MEIATGTILLIILLVLLLLLLILLWLLWARINHRFPFPPAYPREEFILKDEVIIGGPVDSITGALRALTSKGFQLTFIDGMDFSRFGEQLLQSIKIHPTYMITLYRLTGRKKSVKDLQEVMHQINVIYVKENPVPDAEPDESNGLTIFAEVNRVTGSPWDPEPSPWDPEPSPWDPEPSPWDPEPSPWDPEPSPFKEFNTRGFHALAEKSDFANQWAFDLINLTRYARIPMDGEPRGQGVKVAVFDTSPFNLPFNGLDYHTRVELPKPYLSYDLMVRNQPKYSTLPPSSRKHSVRDHGLFVSGLIKAMAPMSTIRLVRVLDRDRRGTLYRLMRAIFDFLIEDIALPGSGAMTHEGRRPKGVINLSLGIRIPPVGESNFAEIGSAYYSLEALRNLMKVAGRLGVMVVAAAGNDSAQCSADLPEKMNFPANLSVQHEEPKKEKKDEYHPVAGLDHILGVSSCTDEPDLKRSCFSNTGSIAAPGGQGEARVYVLPGWAGTMQKLLPWLVARLARPQMNKRVGMQLAASPQAGATAVVSSLEKYFKKSCMPYKGVYQGAGCRYGVVGPILDPREDNPSQTTAPLFRYWPGTSFATPLVSGLAALHMSRDRGNMTPGEIRAVIEATVRVPPGKLGDTPRPNVRGCDDGLGEGIIFINMDVFQPPEVSVKQQAQKDADQAPQVKL